MIILVKGNTKPDLDFEVYEQGEPLLSPPGTALFRLQKPSGNIVTVTLALVDASKARYVGNFGIGDLDEEGHCFGELIVNAQNAEEPIPCYIRAEFREVGT